VRAIHGHVHRLAASRGIAEPRTGAITFAQRFGSTLNLNPHFHAVVLDGAFEARADEDTGDGSAPPLFAVPPPSNAHIRAVLERIVRQARRFLERRADHDAADGASEDARVREILARFQADGVTGAHARREGRLPGLDPEPPPLRKPRCADLHGFTLHAGVTVPAEDREKLEHLCRYALRPPVATAPSLANGRRSRRLPPSPALHRWHAEHRARAPRVPRAARRLDPSPARPPDHRKILAVITHAPTVRAILRCLGIDQRAPPTGPAARDSPAQRQLGLAGTGDSVPDPDLTGGTP